VTIIHREVIAFVPDSQTGNLLACFRESSPGNFRRQLTGAVVHLAQAKLLLCRAMRTEPGRRIKTRHLLETLATIGQAAIESLEGLGESQ
jgi:hypothetical protein